MFVLSPTSLQYERPNTALAEAPITEKLTIPELISFYSEQYGINDEVPLAIAKAESDYKNVCNQENGCIGGIGIFQIVQSTFDEQCKGSPHDIEDNVKCGVKMIKANEYWRWKPSMKIWIEMISEESKLKILSLCNCVTGIRSFGVTIPYGTDAKDIKPNSTPHIGSIALFAYPGSIYHAALVIEITDDYTIIRETNYSKCKETTRKVYFNDPSLRGFYSTI